MTTKKYFKSRFLTCCSLCTVLFSAFLLSVNAQQSNYFNVNLVVRPPASSVFSDYGDLSNKVIITMQNISGMSLNRIALHGSIVLSSDFFITTQYEYAPPVFMSFAPGETKTIISDPAQLRFLNRNAIDPNEFTREVLKTNQLPEGNLTLCVQAFWFEDNVVQPVSNRVCFPLNITRASAPVVTAPYHDQTVPPLQPNIAFAWTPPAGNIIGAQLTYDLYAVKVLPGQSPDDAINGAVNYKANNPFVKTNIIGNQYVTQPFDLKLDTGYTYAVQVVARDVNKKVAFQNNGRSEVVVFNYGDKKPVAGIVSLPMKAKQTAIGSYTVTNTDPVPYSQVRGKLYYKFKDETAASKTQSARNKPQLTAIKPGETLKDDNIGYNTEKASLSDAKPLAGKKVSLVLTYLFSGEIDGKNVTEAPLQKNSTAMGNFPQQTSSTADKVLATTTTSADGSFAFDFANVEKELGLIDSKVNIEKGPVEFRTSLTGKLFKVFRLRVEDKYYCSPDVNIRVEPWKGIDLGTLVSYVKSYTLKVKVVTTTGKFWDMAQGQGTVLSGISTNLIRKGTIPGSVPSNEAGSGENLISFQKDEHLRATAESDKNGYVIFRHLVQHNPDNKADKYYLKCIPQKTKSNFVFIETEKSYYPKYDKDLREFPFNNQREYSPSSSNPNDIILPVPYGEDITWNHQLEVKTYTETIQLYPGKPRIAGTLKVADDAEARPMSNVKVTMINHSYQNISIPQLFKTVNKTATLTNTKVALTNSKGQYQFNDLELLLDTFNPNGVTAVKGPWRIINAKPDGFDQAILPGKKAADSLWNAERKKGALERSCPDCYPPLKWGQQLINQDLFLYPDGILTGYVEDEAGNPVQANINIDGYTITQTKATFLFGGPKGQQAQGKGLQVMTPTGVRQLFSTTAPSGKRKVTIIPDNRDYASKDTTIVITKKGDGGTAVRIVMETKQKRIRFQVAEQKGNGRSAMPGRPISGAIVKIEGIPNSLRQTSDNNGYVTFIFRNNDSNFVFTITPPENADYQTGTYQISGAGNVTQTVTYPAALLKKAAAITGTVTLGPDNKPLEDARVYIDMGNGKTIEVLTDKSGKYTLKGVPATPAEVSVNAGKSGVVPNIITKNKKVTLTPGKENTLNFNLVNDDELAIEKIFGFNVEITKKSEKQQDDTWLIDGNLTINGNDNFSLQDENQTIPFKGLSVKKDDKQINGIPKGVPVVNDIATDLSFMKLFLHDSFSVVQYPGSGDRLHVKGADDSGNLNGKVFVKKISFKFSDQQLALSNHAENALLLTEKPGSADLEIATIVSGTVAKKKFGITGIDGNPMKFNLLGFNASAGTENSWIENNTLNIATLITINALPGMSPSSIDIEAGNLVIHPNGFEPLQSDKPLQFKLENWEFEADNWQLSQNTSSIFIPSGTLHTGSLDVPLKNISIQPDHLSIGGFDITKLTMADIIPVEVLTQKPVFGYSPGVGKDMKPHYELRLIGEQGQPGVQIRSLPGMKPSDAFKFQNFSLISNGEQILNPGNQSSNITLYSVMKVRPLSFTSGSDYVEVDCGIDLGIPQLQETTGILHFTKQSNKIQMDVRPLNITFDGPGYVRFTPNVNFDDKPQQLADEHFTAIGTVTDKQGLKLKSIFHRTAQAAWVQVEPEDQILPLGNNNTSLANVKGKMEADMGAYMWKNFEFSGEMRGFTGMQGDTRKKFTVTGSINASNETVEVENIPSGFGNIGITYDIANSRFLGNVRFDKVMGPARISGVADFIADPGGWYFLAGGRLQAPGFGEMNAGLLIGHYTSMPTNVSQKLMQFAYDKSVPAGFKAGISGFFFTGMKELPILNVPDYSIDLGVISASFGARAGVDGRLWMDFGSSGNEYGVGAMIFAHAYLKGASITCTNFGADARAELGAKGKYSTATGAFSLAGCGSFVIAGSVQQCFPTPCWDGICCTGCIGISKSTGVKIDFLLDSKGNTDLSFGFGNCSGQPVLTGGW